MKVAVINLTGGGMSGGYRNYLRNIIPRMAAHAEVDKILCASPSSLAVQEWFEDISNVSFLAINASSINAVKTDSNLQDALSAFSPDVIFLPVEKYFKFRMAPVVSMVRNMEPLMPPVEGNSIFWRIEHWVRRVSGKRAAINADRVIAVSQFVYDFLHTKWKIPKHKIGLVYHGVNRSGESEIRRPPIIPESWDHEFIFTAGSIRPARGLTDLLHAMSQLITRGEKSIKLVIAGEYGWKSERYVKQLKDWARRNNIGNRICWTGSLNRDEMTWCYQNCNLFVMTSRVESFGQIAGEALSYGCVIVSTDSRCLPEIFGDSAMYYKAGDGVVLAEKIMTAFNLGKKQREKLSQQGIARAREFSWDICAERTIDELIRAVEFFRK